MDSNLTVVRINILHGISTKLRRRPCFLYRFHLNQQISAAQESVSSQIYSE